MLNWAVRSVKFLGVEFDQSEDEEVAVSDTTHLRAEDLDFRVECLGGGIGRTTAEVVQDSWSVVLECLDDRAEIVVTQCYYGSSRNSGAFVKIRELKC